MTRSVKVSGHTRRLPDKAPDPFKPVMEAKRPAWCRKFGVELVGANDDRLAAPIADPVPGPAPMSLEEHGGLLRVVAWVARQFA